MNIGRGPSVLCGFQPDQVTLDLLGEDGWNRTVVPTGKAWRIGNPDLSYEVEIRVRPRDQGRVRATRLHRLLHLWHQRLHSTPDDPWEYGT